MKKLTILALMLAFAWGASAQFYMHVWYNDSIFTFPVLKVDSITFTDKWLEPGEPVDPEPETPSEGIGVFSVSADKQVTFSPGNLQYTQSTNAWSFAENQYDYLGEANIAVDANVLADKVDLFGWSTSATNFGVSTSFSNSDYSGSFVDWGTNQIGNDVPNTWRTLSYDEWEYLLNNRPNASSLCGVAQVNGVNGLIFLPDNWVCPSDITFKSGFHSSYGVDYYAAYQTFTVEQWSKLEAAGAVFLPAAGYRNGTNVYGVQGYGYYWSATEDFSDTAHYLYFYSDAAGMDGSNRFYGRSVRLVKDVEGEDIDPEQPGEPVDPEPETPSEGIGTFSVSATKQVTFSPGNLQYHPANNVWQFAENQTDCIGTDNANISADYNGWLDLFGWSTSANNFGVSTSTSSSDYSGSFVDWGTNQIGSDAPNTWRTLSKDEWIYIFYNRPNAQSLFALGSVNGVNGTIILPDNWTTPAGVSFVASTTKGLYWDGSLYHNSNGNNNFLHNIYTSEQWSKMEQAGAVFLPASGARTDSNVSGVGDYGYYWSSTEHDWNIAYDVCLDSSYLNPQNIFRRYNGFSVRLVKDVEDEPVEPEQPGEGGEEPVDPNPNTGNHEAVDLGLSVKWATCNVGATKPEEYGDHFAWGETQPKTTYDWSTYKWYDWSCYSLTKYCYDRNYGSEFFADNKTTLDLSDDAARANWGGSWRMPTDAEITELHENCTWTWTTQNGVYGYKVTSKKFGYTNKSIFLPAAGHRSGSSLYDVDSDGFYWSSSLCTDDPYTACYLGFKSYLVDWNYEYRDIGLTVRPVCQ